MKKKTIQPLVVMLLFVLQLHAQAPNQPWIYQVDNTTMPSSLNDLEVDALGNTYILYRIFDFDQTDARAPDKRVLIFIKKIDVQGNVIWLKKIKTNTITNDDSLSIDDNGNIYVSSIFTGKISFKINDTPLTFNSQGTIDSFIVKLDPSGAMLWAQHLGGKGDIRVQDITINKDNHIIAGGEFNGELSFLHNKNNTYFLNSSSNNSDLFVLKLDSHGQFMWVKQCEVTGNHKSVINLHCDADKNIYINGFFTGVMDTDPGPEEKNITATTEDNNFDDFILKLNSMGKLLHVNHFKNDIVIEGITTDIQGNLFAAGSFYGVQDLNPKKGEHWLTSSELQDSFIYKQDNTGNFLWTKQIKGKGDIIVRDISITSNNHIYVIGEFSDTIQIAPDNQNEINLVSAGSSDIFIVQLNSQGDFIWANTIGGTRYDQATKIKTNKSEQIFIGGRFSGTINSPYTTEKKITTTGHHDIFVSKINKKEVPTLSTHIKRQNDFFTISPNPVRNKKFAIQLDKEEEIVTVRITNLNGILIKQKKYKNTKHIDLTIDQPDGLYLIKVETNNQSKTISLIKG